MKKIRPAYVAAILLLSGCGEVYPPEPFFAEFRHDQYNLERGVLYFKQSSAWRVHEAKFGFKVVGWTVGAVGLDCSKNTTRENPLKYRIDSLNRVIEFGELEKTHCKLGADTSADFLIFPVITSRPFLDPGEIVGTEYFSVTFKAVIR